MRKVLAALIPLLLVGCGRGIPAGLACEGWELAAEKSARERVLELLTKRADVRVFLSDDISRSRRAKIAEKLAALPGVDRVVFETREEAARTANALFGDEVLPESDASELPESFLVYLHRSGRVSEIRDAIEGASGVASVRNDTQAATQLARADGGFPIAPTLERFRKESRAKGELSQDGVVVRKPKGC